MTAALFFQRENEKFKKTLKHSTATLSCSKFGTARASSGSLCCSYLSGVTYAMPSFLEESSLTNSVVTVAFSATPRLQQQVPLGNALCTAVLVKQCSLSNDVVTAASHVAPRFPYRE